MKPNTSMLISRIYEAALDATKWQAFLAAFGASMDSHGGMIWAHDFQERSAELGLIEGGSDVSAAHGFEAGALASFLQYYSSRNVWLQDESLHREGRVVNSTMLYPPGQLKNTEFWTDWLRPQDIFHTGAAIVEKDVRSVNVTLVRPEDAGEYSEAELNVFRELMPHLKTAFALHRRIHRLQAATQAATAVLEALPFGVIMLDRALRLLFATDKAARLAAGTGVLTLREGQPLEASASAHDAPLQALLQGAGRTSCLSEGNAGGNLRLASAAGQQLNLVVTPLPTWADPFGMPAAVAVFLNSPDAAIGSLSGMLRTIYKMTPAEARLTEALVNGDSLQEYADAHGVSIHTCRTQLKAAMAKAGAGRQAELVRLVLTGPAVLRWPSA